MQPIKLVSPFTKEYVRKTAEQYIEEYNNASAKTDFSWVLPADKDKIIYSENSIDWGILNQVVGDYEHAEIFMCTFNPRTLNLEERDNLHNYVDKEGGASTDSFYDDPDKYYDRLYQKDTTIFYEELEHVIKNGDKLDQQNRHLYYNSNFFYPFFTEDYTLTAANKYFDKIHQLSDQKKDELLQLAKNYSLCDLQLVPYPSEGIKDIKMKDGYTFYDLETAKLAVEIIINRIINFENNPQEYSRPTFIFRAYTSIWRKAIQKYIKDYNKNHDEKITINIDEYSLKFPNQSATCSPNNLVKCDTKTRLFDNLEEYRNIFHTKQFTEFLNDN